MTLRIGLIFGGPSVEHEISIISAKGIKEHLDPKKYEVVEVYVPKEGVSSLPTDYDVAFPMIHGTLGEDGALQGLLKFYGIPFVGCDVLASAVCMDKQMCRSVLSESGLPVPPSVTVKKGEAIPSIDFPYPVFVKPCHLGSSVGVAKVKAKEELQGALHEAFKYDSAVIIQQGIEGMEIECAVLGNETVEASSLAQIIPSLEFYSYEAKYLEPQGAEFLIPASLERDVTKKVQEMARTAYRVLGCSGMARIDFFVEKTGKIWINEPNPIPGFTPISMYPRLWAHSGLPYPKLLDRLITLALEKDQENKSFKTDFSGARPLPLKG